MSKVKKLVIPVENITVTLTENGASISSDLDYDVRNESDEGFDAALGVLYAMIMAHATAGVDICAPDYVFGVKLTLQYLECELV